MIQHCRLEPAEAEIERVPLHFRDAKFHWRRRAARRSSQPVENRSAGIAQPKKLRHFVVRFTGGIVARLPQLSIIQLRAGLLRVRTFRFHFVKDRVPAGNNQAHCRQSRRAPGFMRLQENRVHVPFEMIHRNEWLTQRLRQRFSVRNSHQQCAHEARALRHANRIHIGKFHSGLSKRFAHHRHDLPQMFARSQLRHHAAIFSVNVDLRRDHAGQNFAPVSDNRRRCLIAR